MMAAIEIGCDWLPCWFLEVLADPMAAWFSWLARDLFGLQSLRGPAGCACWAGRTCLMPMARVSVVRRLPGCTSSFIFEYSPAVSEGDGAVRSSCGVMGEVGVSGCEGGEEGGVSAFSGGSLLGCNVGDRVGKGELG